jgi:arginase
MRKAIIAAERPFFDTAAAGKGVLVLAGLPADDKSSYLRGAAAAPAAIREALACPSSNLSAEDGRDLGAGGDRPRLADAGDLELGGALDIAAIEAGLGELYALGSRVICLGGDHSVSFPAIRSFVRSRGAKIDVLHLDAHPDLYDSFEGDGLSHACPFARCLDEGLLGRLVQVGIRGMNAEQRGRADKFDVEVIDMILWEEGRRPAFEGDFYLSLDLDALDPAFAPGVSHREPGGLTTREVISLLRRTPGRLVGADIVELNPARDAEGMAAMVAAKLLKEIAARMLRDWSDILRA